MESDVNNDDHDGTRFDPPLYRQRYKLISQIIEKEFCKKVVDFGCAEGKLYPMLKELDCLEHYIGVDILRTSLAIIKSRAQPNANEYLFRRKCPMRCTLLAGSVTQYDYRLADSDAIVMIELIEHLHAHELAALPEVIFGQLHPRLVIVTTPNADYNVLFPDFSGFRHWDHKFEWNQAQFSEWCMEIGRRYGYRCELTGVGAPPDGREELGFCSQACVFRAYEFCQRPQSLCYDLVAEIHTPHEEITPTREQLSNEVFYLVTSLRREYRFRMERGEFDEIEENMAFECQGHQLTLSNYGETLKIPFAHISTSLCSSIDACLTGDDELRRRRDALLVSETRNLPGNVWAKYEVASNGDSECSADFSEEARFILLKEIISELKFIISTDEVLVSLVDEGYNDEDNNDSNNEASLAATEPWMPVAVSESADASWGDTNDNDDVINTSQADNGCAVWSSNSTQLTTPVQQSGFPASFAPSSPTLPTLSVIHDFSELLADEIESSALRSALVTLAATTDDRVWGQFTPTTFSSSAKPSLPSRPMRYQNYQHYAPSRSTPNPALAEVSWDDDNDFSDATSDNSRRLHISQNLTSYSYGSMPDPNCYRIVSSTNT